MNKCFVLPPSCDQFLALCFLVLSSLLRGKKCPGDGEDCSDYLPRAETEPSSFYGLWGPQALGSTRPGQCCACWSLLSLPHLDMKKGNGGSICCRSSNPQYKQNIRSGHQKEHVYKEASGSGHENGTLGSATAGDVVGMACGLPYLFDKDGVFYSMSPRSEVSLWVF